MNKLILLITACFIVVPIIQLLMLSCIHSLSGHKGNMTQKGTTAVIWMNMFSIGYFLALAIHAVDITIPALMEIGIAYCSAITIFNHLRSYNPVPHHREEYFMASGKFNIVVLLTQIALVVVLVYLLPGTP